MYLPLSLIKTISVPFLVLGTCLPSLVPSAQAVVVIEHIGSNDPTTEGWTFNDYMNGGGTLAGGTDTEAHWRIARDANVTGRYLYTLNPADVSDPTGWTLTVRAKLNASDRVDQAYFGVSDSSTNGHLWSLHLLNIGGTGVYQLIDPDIQGPHVSSLDPSLDYHTYAISYNPLGDGGSGEVTYYVDGLAVGTQTRATAHAQSLVRIEWGDSWYTNGASDAQYSLVRFETGQVPEPVGAAMFAISGVPLLCRRSSRKA